LVTRSEARIIRGLVRHFQEFDPPVRFCIFHRGISLEKTDSLLNALAGAQPDNLDPETPEFSAPEAFYMSEDPVPYILTGLVPEPDDDLARDKHLFVGTRTVPCTCKDAGYQQDREYGWYQQQFIFQKYKSRREVFSDFP
jgi:hypothetical protein